MPKGIGEAIFKAQSADPIADEIAFEAAEDDDPETVLTSDLLPGVDHALARCWQAIDVGDEKVFKRALRSALELLIESAFDEA